VFNNRLYTATPRHRQVYGSYERVFTLVDFSAALLFVAGSVCFFFPELMTAGTWAFLVGSLAFAAKPSVRVAREFHLSRLPLPGDLLPGQAGTDERS
jgi:hypothetical protein